MLITLIEPIKNPKNVRIIISENLLLEDLRWFKHRHKIIKKNGILIKWACKSANKKVKNGNSLISNPGGSGVIILVLCQKLNSVNIDELVLLVTILITWNSPSKFPRMQIIKNVRNPIANLVCVFALIPLNSIRFIPSINAIEAVAANKKGIARL